MSEVEATRHEEPKDDAAARPRADWLPFLLGATALYVFDTFYMNQGVLAGLAGLLGLVSLLTTVRASSARRWRMVGRALPFILCAVASTRTNQWMNAVARERAMTIVAACERYHDDTGSYPEELTDLVPTYMASIPAAKWGVVGRWGEFLYLVSEDSHSVMYTSLPPFGRPYYRLEEHRWRYLD